MDEGYFIGLKFVGLIIINTVEGTIPQLHVAKVLSKFTYTQYRLSTADNKKSVKTVTDGRRNQYFESFSAVCQDWDNRVNIVCPCQFLRP